MKMIHSDAAGESTENLVHSIQDIARPLTGARSDYDPLFDLIGDARLVLIGEASHGTHEFIRHARSSPMNLRARNHAVVGLRQPRLQRAIGVIYRPETERQSHYFRTRGCRTNSTPSSTSTRRTRSSR